MTGFEPRTSGIGSDRSTNWATTTSQKNEFLELDFRWGLFNEKLTNSPQEFPPPKTFWPNLL